MNFQHFFQKNWLDVCTFIRSKNNFLKQDFCKSPFRFKSQKMLFFDVFPPKFCYKNRCKIWYTLLEKFSDKIMLGQLSLEMMKKNCQKNSKMLPHRLSMKSHFRFFCMCFRRCDTRLFSLIFFLKKKTTK